jgi:glycosyltransferase involved in cell wall biosynthesis
MKNSIVFLIDTLVGGGAEKVVITLASALINRGYSIHLIITENCINYDIPKEINLHILSNSAKITGIKFLDRYILSRRLKEKIKIISSEYCIKYFFSNLSRSHIVSKLAKIDCYYIIHNNLSESFKVRKKTKLKYTLAVLQARLLYNNEKIITVSKGVKNDLIEKIKIKPKSITVIYNPFDINDIMEKAEQFNKYILSYKPYIIYVGSFKKQKRLDRLLKSYALAKTEHKLIILGEGSKQEKNVLEQLITYLNITNKVIFIGWQKNPYNWIKHANLLLLTSDYEGLPTVLIESLICNTPIVSTNCPSGPNEILTDDLEKFLVKSFDENLIAIKINEVLNDEIMINETNYIKFSIDNITKEYLELKENNFK